MPTANVPGSDVPTWSWPNPRSVQWVWAPPIPDERNAYVCFRREFDLPRAPRNLQLRISADSRYRAYLNGKLIGEGPPPSLPTLTYYDTYDMSAMAKSGPNCLAVVVHHIGGNPPYRGGFIAELSRDGESIAATSADWRCLRSSAWVVNTQFFRGNSFDPYQEVFDAKLEPAGWKLAGFDDASWSKGVAVPGGGPWQNLSARDIPMMAEATLRPEAVTQVEECTWLENRYRSEDLSICLAQAGLPVKFSRAENVEGLVSGAGPAVFASSTNHVNDPTFDGVREPCVTLDFGKVITAHVELDIEGPAGAAVDIGMAERLVDGRFNNAIEAPFCARYTLKEGRQSWRTFPWRGFRYLRLRFHQCFSPVKLHALQAITTTYPYEEKGSFHTSDARVQKVFNISRYTIRLCSHESIMDTPWREQAQWLGDVAAVTLGGIYACFGDTRLPAKFFRQSGGAQRSDGLIANITNYVAERHRPIPDYSLWWIMGLWNHYLYTGEKQWIENYYPHTLRVLEPFLRRIDADGLVCDMPGWVLIDWAHLEVKGRCTALNALVVGAMEAALKMARLREDDLWAGRLEKLIAGIRAAAVKHLYDPSRGVFADANIDGQLAPMASEHASSAAIYWGLCDQVLASQIAKRLWEDGSIKVTEAQPFFATVVLWALDRIGRFDLAMRYIRDHWGKRMVDKGATSTYEEWGVNGSWRYGPYSGFLRSFSHAWSACPAEFLIRNLAGIEILEPGCRSVRVSPRPVDFDYELAFPTPLGPIHVRQQQGRAQWRGPEAIRLVGPGQ
jgi:hypothetical protein